MIGKKDSQNFVIKNADTALSFIRLKLIIKSLNKTIRHAAPDNVKLAAKKAFDFCNVSFFLHFIYQIIKKINQICEKFFK